MECNNTEQSKVPVDERGIEMIYDLGQKKYVPDVVARARAAGKGIAADAEQAVRDHNGQPSPDSGGRWINGIRYRF